MREPEPHRLPHPFFLSSSGDKMPLMRRSPTGGLTIKAALILGFGLTLAIWLVTGYQFAESMATAEQQADRDRLKVCSGAGSARVITWRRS